MARAIELDGPAGKNGSHAVAPLDLNPAAQRAASDLLNRLYDHGILDFIRALASGGDAISRIVTTANGPKSVRAMRNGLSLLNILASFDPGFLERVSKSLSQHYSVVRPPNTEPPGLWSIVRRMTGRNSRRTLAVIA